MLHERPVARQFPLFGGTGGRAVRADAGGVQEFHAEGHAEALGGQAQQALPDAEPGPVDEGLCRLPSGPVLGRHGAQIGPIVVPPENAFDPLAQI